MVYWGGKREQEETKLMPESKKRTNVRLSEELHARLKSLAAHKQTTIEVLLEQAAQELVEKIESGESEASQRPNTKARGVTSTTNIMPLIQGLANVNCERVTLGDLEFLISVRSNLTQELNPNLIQELLSLRQ